MKASPRPKGPWIHRFAARLLPHCEHCNAEKEIAEGTWR